MSNQRTPDHDQFPLTVRTTIQPDLEVEITTVQEWTDLQRQGLLLEGHDGTEATPTPAPARPAAPIRKD